LLLSGTAVAGKVTKSGGLYKWTDENGVVHYGDHVPPQYAKGEREELNDQGVTVNKFEAQKTPEQIRAEKEKAAQEKQQKEEAERRARQDRLLLDTYSSVHDLEMARDSRISAIESQIRVTSSNISNLQQSIADLEDRTESFKKGGRPVPQDLQDQLDEARKNLLDNQQFLISRQQEVDRLRQKFSDDIKRFRQLQTQQRAANR
jgi:hypothetical protein